MAKDGDAMGRMLRFPEIIERTGLSRTTIWRQVRAGEFPAPVALSGNAVGWHDAEINHWLNTRPRVHYVPPQIEPVGAGASGEIDPTTAIT